MEELSPRSSWLKFAAAAVLLGQALDHWWGDPPYREIWWDQRWWGGLVAAFGATWREYVSSAWLNYCIQWQIDFFGLMLALTGLGVLFLPSSNRLVRAALLMSSFLLFLLAFALWKEQFWQIGQLLESSLLWTTPVIWLQWSRGAVPWAINLARGATAATFVGHGLYALGFHPVPAHFVGMTMRLLACPETMARQALLVMGGLDLVVAGLVLLQRRWVGPALAYMAVWGLITALARIAANLYWPFWETWLAQWWRQMIWRLPHGMVPWWLYLEMRARQPTWPKFPPSSPDRCSPVWPSKWRRRKA